MGMATLTIYPQDILSAFAEVRTRDVAAAMDARGNPSGLGGVWGHRREDYTYCSLCPIARAARRTFPDAPVVEAGGSEVALYDESGEFLSDWESPMIRDVIRTFDDSRTSLEVLERFSFPLSINLQPAPDSRAPVEPKPYAP